MIKVLIGDSNIQQDIQDFNFLKNNNDIQVITSTSGSETIAKCKEVEPSIIILSSSFVDMNYADVIDKISILPNEFDKCNLILKVNNPKTGDNILMYLIFGLLSIAGFVFSLRKLKKS